MYDITIQCVIDKMLVPKFFLLRKWAKLALSQKVKAAEITLRLVSSEEMAELNFGYRKKSGPTNVLSFPFTVPQGFNPDTPLLGDIVICADVVNREAFEQHKSPEAHWAHMVVHGICHLLGYDHEDDSEALIMEKLEIDILRALGFNNPYSIGENSRNND